MGSCRFFNATMVALMVVMLIACAEGGAGGLRVNPSSAPTEHQRSITLNQALAEIDEAPLPEGVSAQSWSQLKSAFRQTLLARGVSEFTSAPPIGFNNRVDDMKLLDNGDATYTLTWSYKNVGDYDQNGEVNIADMTPVGRYFHANTASSDWTAASVADGDGNGEVNIADLTPIGLNFLHTVEGYRLQESRLLEGVLPEQVDIPLAAGHEASQVGEGIVFSCPLPLSDADHTWVVPVAPGELLGEPSDIMPITAGGGDASTTVKVSENVEQLHDSVASQITISQNGTNLSIPKTAILADELAAGKILVSTLGQGFLKKVLSYTETGISYDVQVEQAALDEMFDRAVICFFRDITTEDVLEETSQVRGIKASAATSGFQWQLVDTVLWDADGNEFTTNDQVVANGILTVTEPRFEFKLDLNHVLGVPTSIKEFRFVMSETITADLTVGAEMNLILVDKKIRLYTWSLIPFTVTVGHKSFTLGPELGLSAGLVAGASLTFETGITASASASVGVSYYGGWSTIQSFDKSFEYTPPTLSGNAKVKAYFGPEVNLNMLGNRVAYAELYGYGRMEADTNASPWWVVKGGLECNLGVNAGILSLLLPSWSSSIPLYEWILGEAYPPTPKPVVNSVSPTSGQPGDSVSFSATVSGPQPYTSYAWDFGGGASPNTSSQASPTVTLGSAGQYNCALTVSNAFGASQPYQFTLVATPVEPAAPTNIQATDGIYLDKIRITWTASPGADYYLLFRSPSQSGAYANIGQTAALLYDDNPPDTNSYWYKAKAHNSNGDSAYSNSDSGYEGIPPLNPPTNLQASDGDYNDKVHITWTASTGADSYLVYRSTSQNGTYTNIGQTIGTSYDDDPGDTSTYWYRAKAHSTNGDSDHSNSDSGSKEIVPPPVPNPPTNLQASDGTYSDRVRISWNPSADADLYYIYRGTSYDGSYSQIGQVASSPYDDYVSDGISYWYKAKAHNNSGDSNYSNEDSGYNDTPPTGEWVIRPVEESACSSCPLKIVSGRPAIVLGRSSDIYFVRASDSQGTAWGNADFIASVPGGYTSLEIVQGNPAISFYDQANGDLLYRRAEDAIGFSWGSLVSVYSTGNIGMYNSMSILVDGTPAIGYIDIDLMDLQFVCGDDITGSSWGIPELVDNVDSIYYTCSLSVVSGYPAIAYYDGTIDSLMYVRATNANGGSWETPLAVDAGPSSFEGASMTIINGRPAISYYDGNNRDLKFVRASDPEGSDWGNPRVLDVDGSCNCLTSLAVINGVPAVSYRSFSSGDVKYIKAGDVAGNSWTQPEVVDNAEAPQGDTCLAEVLGNPAISYIGSGMYLKYAYFDL